jgi:hypothetical protein
MGKDAIRAHLANLLTQTQAHMGFEGAIDGFPMAEINTRPPNVPYSIWHLLEHLRIAQHDILDYCRNPHYQSMRWPEDYWPAPDAMTDAAGWQATIDGFLADRAALVDIALDEANDLTAQLAHGEPGHTLLREILLAADHNAYHVGELAILRGVMGWW